MEYILVALTVYVLYWLKNKYWQPAGAQYQYNAIEDKQINTNQTSYLALIVLILFFGLRNISVGGDTQAYYNNFVLTYEGGELTSGLGFGFLYQLVTLICAKLFGLGVGFNISLIIYASIICLCVNFTVKSTSQNMPLAMFIFATIEIYLRSFSLLRQNIAVAILSVAFVFAIKKKPLHFLCMILIATLFHTSAPIFLIVYPLTKIQVKHMSLSLSVSFVGSLIFGFFHKEIIYLVTRVYGQEYYNSYVSKIGDAKEFLPISWRDISVVMFGVVITSLLFIYIVFYCKKNKQWYCSCLLVYWLYPLCRFISAIQMSYKAIYSRLTPYFSWLIILFAPNLLKEIENTKIRISAIILLIIMCFTGTYLLFSTQDLLPYAFMWG